MLKRDKDYIEKNIYIKDNQVFTKEKLIIEFPKWYENKELLDMKEKTYLYGIFAMIIDDKYSVSIIPTLINTNPILVNEISRKDEEYVQFIYGKNSCIIEDLNVVKKDLLSYNLFENFIIYARIPWFLEYDDIIKILDNLYKYANSNLGNNYISTELVTSFIARVKNNKTIFYRQKNNEEIDYVSLLNVYYSAISTVGKLAGNYFQESLVSAIVQKEKEPTKLENIVRK